MGFSTMPITVGESEKLVRDSDGEVVSATHKKYFNNKDWLELVEKAAIEDDGITIIFTVYSTDFIEYCCVKSTEMTRKAAVN